MVLEELGVQSGIIALGKESFKPGKGRPQAWLSCKYLIKSINICCVQLHVVHVL